MSRGHVNRKNSYMPIEKPSLDGYIHNNSREKVFFAFGKTTFSRKTNSLTTTDHYQMTIRNQHGL